MNVIDIEKDFNRAKINWCVELDPDLPVEIVNAIIAKINDLGVPTLEDTTTQDSLGWYLVPFDFEVTYTSVKAVVVVLQSVAPHLKIRIGRI